MDINDTAPAEIDTLSLHDALPIFGPPRSGKSTIARVLTSIVGNDKDRKSTRLNSSHVEISYAVFCLKKKTAAFAAFSIAATPASTIRSASEPFLPPVLPGAGAALNSF